MELLDGPNKAIMSSFDATPGMPDDDAVVVDGSLTTCVAVPLKKSNSARSDDAATFDVTVVEATDVVDTGAPRKFPNSTPSDLESISGDAEK